MRSPAVVGTLAVTFLVMTASNSMYTYAVLLDGAAGPVGLGLFIGAFGLGGMVGTWSGGTAADRGGGDKTVVLLAETVCLMALARDNGSRVVCVTATRGELGTPDPVDWPPDRLAAERTGELARCLEILGVTEHHWLGYRDGECAQASGRTWSRGCAP